MRSDNKENQKKTEAFGTDNIWIRPLTKDKTKDRTDNFLPMLSVLSKEDEAVHGRVRLIFEWKVNLEEKPWISILKPEFELEFFQKENPDFGNSYTNL